RGDATPGNLARRVARLYYPDGPAEAAPEPGGPRSFSGQLDAEESPRLAGRYRCEDLDVVYKISIAEHNLRVGFGHNEVTLHPGKPHQFLNEWMTITTTADGFVLDTERARNFRFRKLP
ncbi:MAG: hypothetical protein ACKV2V_18805, partial [Blastocatellia bacterium]